MEDATRDADADMDRRDPFAVPAATRRHEIKGSTGLVLLAGAWLIMSPFLLPYESAVWRPLLAGAAIVLLAIARLAIGLWHTWISWLNAILGGWLVATTSWLAESATATWNEALLGGAVVVLAVLSGGATDAARRTRRARVSRRTDRLSWP